MILIRDFYNVQERHRPSVVSIGNFDGVHVGHVRLLGLLKEQAQALGVKTTAMTFEPHPHEFFSPQNAPPRLLRWRDKIEKLTEAGVDQVFSLRFNQTLAQTSAEDFVKKYLVDGLGVRHVVIGDDFRFGRKRIGDVHLLRELGERWGFSISTVDTYIIAGERVSSTRIREALRQDDFDLAEDLLGYRYAIQGRVAHGDRRGRTIGFPTANIVLPHDNIPVWGVYAVRAHFSGRKSQAGVANIGIRPTVGGERVLLEVHLFDFSEEIYAERVRVEFQTKIRPERRFESFEALKEQIARDASAARQWFDE
ncbi:MAG: bifunctional riboflavin kinase/FMN adenylyltransferase [Acidiferrobacteraceae bacterium]|jgi:riboflavin kinase/FMN adenylyltransferase|nr:bifunctional riboflavin kinase/FMN adenylyltransferase [Acidiferrobacteraceae bacterium]MDP6552455.1 bifunctional riboflavin kinase/FAD synthetase [Arenicellales bacterium]MDP6792088.1 bifunctional riboflavin kinase/FAD synthetase [Arenicellales bacterium]MDP6918269.1 bifunctional riboflavin kinase/FAD synthetase [Arenicellales bacterium]|tara:strand:+ start:6464 stop:7390 length:927 start_codon:yes stop_codon:yes gene_type:complete